MAVYQLTLVAVMLSVLVSASQAWFFSRRYPSAKANGRAVDNKCVAKAMEGSCDFYDCFEQRLWCGRRWYNHRYGGPYCKDFQAFSSKFSPRGQKFINASQLCITKELMTWYERDVINCHDYTHFAFKALSRCYIKNNFCDAIKSDGLNFVTIFRPQHLFQSGALKIWREILRIAFHCEPDSFQMLITTFWESLSSDH